MLSAAARFLRISIPSYCRSRASRGLPPIFSMLSLMRFSCGPGRRAADATRLATYLAHMFKVFIPKPIPQVQLLPFLAGDGQEGNKLFQNIPSQAYAGLFAR